MKAMHCSHCKDSVQPKKLDEYHLDTVGLPNVWLTGVQGYTCEKCGNRAVMLPLYGQLMATIAQAVVFKNESYSSQEIAFLKSFFGFKSKEIAQKLGTNEKTVCFWMKGKSNVSPAYGIKLRKFFSDELHKYVSENESNRKALVKAVEKYHHKVRDALSEREVLQYLRQRAKQTASGKMKEAEVYSKGPSDAAVFRIPDSSVGVTLRN